jgi:beta-1,2-mannobiose phosphorylase / 1,2-beta-oligomannan phosphorylase
MFCLRIREFSKLLENCRETGNKFIHQQTFYIAQYFIYIEVKMKKDVKILLQPEDFKPSFPNWRIRGVLNPGGVRIENGKVVLFVRVAEGPAKESEDCVECPIAISGDEYKTKIESISNKKIIKTVGNNVFLEDGLCVLNDISVIKKVVLDSSGMFVEKIEEKPVITGGLEYSECGVEDPRITKLGKEYLMTFVAVSRKSGIVTALASSNDLIKWKHHGIIFQEQNKDVVIFPEKINGMYAALNRPEANFITHPQIWISYSPDLVFWGKEKPLLSPRNNSWESSRNGAGPPPIKTKKGWLVIYHGVESMNSKSTYCAGVALLDLKNPEKVLMRSPIDKPLIKPTEKYERVGLMNNVVFPTTAIPSLKGDDLIVYSGGADSVITVRKISLKEIFSSMEKC